MSETITKTEKFEAESPSKSSNSQAKMASSLMSACNPMLVTHEELQPEICNIMATFNVNCRLDLKKIAMCTRNSIYCPKRFSALNLKIRNPHATALVFKSGKVVCTGTRAEDMAYLACRKFARILQKFQPKASFRDFKLRMLSGTIRLNFPINLDGMYLCHRRFISFEPELFPGLIYKMLQPKVTLVIYVTGKIVITGSTKRKDLHDAFVKLFPLLKLFKKEDVRF